MVHQFKFSEGKAKGSFNNTIYTYINNLHAAKKYPKITDEKKKQVKDYFKPLLKNLEECTNKRN